MLSNKVVQLHEPFYFHTLKESLSQRQRKNPAYSLRAFAKDLEIDSSNLSAILQKKRNLPSARAKAVARKLKLSPQDSALFVLSTHRKNTRLDAIKIKEVSKQYLLDEKYYRIISEWEYFAFLQLLSTPNFKSDFSFVSKRLGISANRSKQVVETLLALGFIGADDEKGFKRLTPALETSEDIFSQALQESHSDSLQIAKEKLEAVPVGLRDFSSITMAVNPEKLPEAKAIIREFQEKLFALMSVGPTTEVYQFSSQLFPLSQSEIQI